MLKVGILGYGGIARSHRRGYEQLMEQGAPVQLVALCDINPDQFTNLVTINQGGADTAETISYHTYTALDDMLAQEELDVVDICLPTYLHCEYAVKLLEKGYHVQSEKPMGLNSEECAKMLKAAENSKGKLMIGMCLRFDSLYLALKQMIDEGTYGRVETAHFDRLSGLPRWGFDGWFRDYNRAGGVALDMHIHDVDMIRFLFGDPKAVSALTSDSRVRCTTVNSQFIYPDKLVSAIGDWGQSNSSKFKAGYRVNFEKATVVMENSAITVYPDEGEPFAYPLEKKDHMAEESLFFAKTILGETENTKNTPADAASTVALVEKLMESAENGGRIVEV